MTGGLDVEPDFELPPRADAATRVDLCAQHLVIGPEVRQSALEQLDVEARVRLVTAGRVAQAARVVGDGGRASN